METNRVFIASPQDLAQLRDGLGAPDRSGVPPHFLAAAVEGERDRDLSLEAVVAGQVIDVAAIVNVGVADLLLVEKRRHAGGLGVGDGVVDGDADEGRLAAERRRSLAQLRHLRDAGDAPRRPDVDDAQLGRLREGILDLARLLDAVAQRGRRGGGGEEEQ
jgi:hypothetical protein